MPSSMRANILSLLFLLSVSSQISSSSATNVRRELPAVPTCVKHIVPPGSSSAAVYQWNGNENNDWTDVANWIVSGVPAVSLPGTTPAGLDRALIAGSDQNVVVACDTSTYLLGRLRIDIRQATMDIWQNLRVKRDLIASQDATVTVIRGTLQVENKMELADTVTLNVGHVGKLQVDGNLVAEEGSVVTFGKLASIKTKNMDLAGTVLITLHTDGTIKPIVVHGSLTIASTASLVIDMGLYKQFDPTTITLFEYTSSNANFDPSQVTVIGLDDEYLDVSLNQAVGSSTGSFLIQLEIMRRESPARHLLHGNHILDLSTNAAIPVHGVLEFSSDFQLTVKGGDHFNPPVEGIRIDLFQLIAQQPTLGRKFPHIHDNFDVKQMRIIDMAPGFWYEIDMSTPYSIALEVRPLHDYSTHFKASTYSGIIPFQEVTPLGTWPDFSWETVPKYIHIRKNNELEPEELDAIANNYNMAFISNVLNGRASLEEGIESTAIELKNRNSNFKSLFYWNSRVWWGDRMKYEARNDFSDDWLLMTEDTNGNLVPRTVSVDDGRHMFDQSNPEMVKWWLGVALDMANNENIDGLFIDAAGCAVNVTDEVCTDHARMLKVLGRNMPEGKLNIANTLRQGRDNGTREQMTYLDGSYMENWYRGGSNMSDILSASIQLARESLNRGKLIMMNGSPWHCHWPGCDATEAQMQEEVNVRMTTGVFLMLAEEHAYMSYQSDPKIQSAEPLKWDSHSLPDFQCSLGKPLGPPVRYGKFITRSFEHLNVTLDMESEVPYFDWESCEKSS